MSACSADELTEGEQARLAHAILEVNLDSELNTEQISTTRSATSLIETASVASQVSSKSSRRPIFHHGNGVGIGRNTNASVNDARRSAFRSQATASCRYCHKNNHSTVNCPELRSNRRTTKCFACNEIGHFARDCKSSSRRRNSKNGKPRTHVPTLRSINEIYEDDETNKTLYEHVVEEDEQVNVTGVHGSMAVIENWNDAPSLDHTLMLNIKRSGYVRPRKIQSYAIPLILEGRDLKAQAETGSGKSGAFLIPIISMIADRNARLRLSPRDAASPRAIVLEPTRELVIQVYEQAAKLAVGTGVQVNMCYGEYDVTKNAESIIERSDIIIGTIDRFRHFFEESFICFASLKYLVIDEADRQLDDTFKARFCRMTSLQGFPTKNDGLQTLLFSATYPPHLEDWLDSILSNDYVTIRNERANRPNTRVVQGFEECAANSKMTRLLAYCEEKIKKANDAKEPLKMLAFVDTRDKVAVFTSFLRQNKINASPLSSDLLQTDREIIMSAFREGTIPILIGTDLCARGLDIKELNHVVNVDLPKDLITYVQRVGRTGRLNVGNAYSFVDTKGDAEIGRALVKMLEEDNAEVPDFLAELKSKPFTGRSPRGARY